MAFQQLQNLVKVLESYRGHDGIIRLVNYVAMFMGGEGNTPSQTKWRTVAKELSACRVVLRLFDDLPMLLHNLSTGFGFKVRKYINFTLYKMKKKNESVICTFYGGLTGNKADNDI